MFMNTNYDEENKLCCYIYSTVCILYVYIYKTVCILYLHRLVHLIFPTLQEKKNYLYTVFPSNTGF